MRHFVLTRSAYGPAWDRVANRRRLAITRAGTARLMAAQSSKDWTWVVLLDVRDPFLAERRALFAAAAPAFIPLEWRPPGDTDVVPLTRASARRARIAAADYGAPWCETVGPHDDQVLTTRLDDDDGLALDGIARYQAAAQGITTRTALMLPVGVHVWRGRYAVVRHERNAMHTLVSPPGDDWTVYSYGHTKVREKVPVVMVDDKPGWLWVRHRETISDARNPGRWAARRPAPLTPAIRALFPVDWAAISR